MAKSLHLIHARSSFKEDYTGLGYDVSGIEEQTLEAFCLALPPHLIPIFQQGGGQQ